MKLNELAELLGLNDVDGMSADDQIIILAILQTPADKKQELKALMKSM